MEQTEARMSRTAAALLLIVLAMLLAPMGIVVTQVIAQVTAFSRPGVLLVAPDPISDAVAATPAEFRVDESGAATYSVPLFAVPGTAGVAPQLSLNYSSQGGYGPMGRGWSVGGLSAISRCRATREAGDFLAAATPDGDPRPINFTGTDRYCLDGQRLVPSTAATCPAVSGLTAHELRTEIDSFQRVCAYHHATNGPAFFTVERKDGSTSWYGDRDTNSGANRPDGYFESTANGQTTKAMSWAQTRFQDSTGNTIDYHYLKNPAGAGTGEHLISEVRYTGKVALAGQAAPASDPFAKVVFNYAARPATAQGKGYASGGLLTQSRRLDSITSCATIDCLVGYQVRHYLLTYQPSPSGNEQDTLIGLQECRDTRADVCASPTVFEWSTATHDFSTSESVGTLVTGGVTITSDHYRGHKLGDINGDGRPDLMIQYLAGHGCVGGTWIVSALGTLNGAGQPTFGNVVFNCVTANITSRGDGAWHLFDYNGDGLDDLFVSSATNAGWRVHPSNGTHFDMSTNLIAGLSPAIPSVDSDKSQVQLADLNGDGLTDIVYPRSGGMKTRLMERLSGAFAWGAERSVVVDESTLVPPALGCDDPFNQDVRNCQTSISGMPTTKTGFMQMTDLNGDAASDLLIRITTQADVWTNYPGCIREIFPEALRASGSGYIDRYEDPDEPTGDLPRAPPGDPCWSQERSDLLYGLGVDEQDTGALILNNLVPLSSGDPYAIVFADTNGDGLSDPIVRGTSSSDWVHRVNNGLISSGGGVLPLANYRDQSRFVDVTGDGRADLVHLVNYGSYKAYAVQKALPSGGFAASVPLLGGNARICTGSGCNEQLRIPIFADFDGDGQLDFLSMDIGAANIGLYVSRSHQRAVPRDVIVRITNGLGAKTELAYAPMTNTAIYRRVSGSRNGLDWGRGSPVMDFLAPMYVVARASSSAPVAGNPNAMASVHYRYANARTQAGGRGFLGFATIETIDPNQTGGHVVTTTSYGQNFPFVGMPLRTIKSAVAGVYTVPACLTGAITNACFAGPGTTHPSLGGAWFSDSQQVWQVAPDSLATLTPLHVRTLGTEETLRDPFTQALTSKVATAFSYGANGNVSQTIVDTYTGSATMPTATVITDNLYSDDTTRWRLGRLTSSTVTHRRPGQTDVERTTGFSYQMSGATTGLLTEERLQPGGAAHLASAKAYQLDDYGNRLQTTTCAGPSTPCSTSGMQFQPTTATHVRRYARVEYDAQGRFPVATYEPFWSETGGIEARTSYVVNRNVFGDPIELLDVNNVRSYAVKGGLGRDYYAWQQTTFQGSIGSSGVRSLTTYRTCSQVDCPAGAAFRQQVEVTAGPRKWTWFDVLGRPVMQAGETFNVGVSGKDVSAACTDYDGVGRPSRVSNPFFLAGTADVSGPTGLAGVCSAGARQWTITSYDVLGRPVLVQAPDASQASVGYAGLTTTKTDPRGKATTETRNGLGEMVVVTDAGGLAVGYNYFADGTVGSVMRNAGAGMITNYFSYDVLGRKTGQLDPDTGWTSFEYNALGELTAQVDALGNRTEHRIDARGRIWRTTVKDFNGLTETESTFTFDTAPMSSQHLGQLARETITGTYAGWSGQPNTALSFDREHYVDVMGRPAGNTVQMDGQVFGAVIQYDALGRPLRAMDASQQAVKTEYGPRGHALALCATDIMFDTTITCAGVDTYQRTLETDAWGNVARERRGDNAALEVARTVWADTGRVASICAGNGSCNLVNEQYGWDAAGNLSSHLKEQRYLETFTYDDLNRLSTGTLMMRDGVTVNQATVSMGFDALGNICSRNGTGYSYGAAAGCSGSSGMAAMPVAVAAAQPSRTKSLQAMPAASEPREQRAQPRASRNLVAWQVPAVWRDRFVQHAPERSRSSDRDRASFMDDDEDWGLAHGTVSESSTSVVSRSGSNTASTGGAAGASVIGAFMVSPMSAGSGGPHAASQTVSGGNATTYTYDHRGNQVGRDAPGTADDRTIAYSVDDKAHEITMGSGQRVRFWYGPDGQRYKREEAGKVTYYVGGVEVVIQAGITTMKRYVGGIALQTIVSGVVQSTKYLFHDQLGSLVRIANADGSLAERLDYQAFGGRRNPSDPHAAGTASPNTPRGYTGHEYVDGTGVIHMNGRIYDSELGRFLQADPVIQAPNNTQSWNAYTYVFNNPFAYTDPTGMISFRQIFAVVFAAVYAYFTWDLTGASAIYAAMIGGAITGGIATGTWRGALTGAFTGAVTAGIGWAAQTYEWGNTVRIAAQAASGGVMEVLQGGNFGNGFVAAGLTAAMMPQIGKIGNDVGRTITGAIVGGTISEATGGKFANGAISGAIQAAMSGQPDEAAAGVSSEGAGEISDQTGASPEIMKMLSDPQTAQAGLRAMAAREHVYIPDEQILYEDVPYFRVRGRRAAAKIDSKTRIVTFSRAAIIRKDYWITLSYMQHEYGHWMDYTFGLGYPEVDEIRAYEFQMRDSNFKRTAPWFQKGTMQMLDSERALFRCKENATC